MKTKLLKSLSAMLLLVASINISVADTPRKNLAFVTVKGTHFSRQGKPYYIVGANLWYAGYLGSSGTVGDRGRLARELDKLKAMGINNLRVLAVSERSSLSTAVSPATTNAFGQYNESLLVGLDYLLAELAKRDMTVVLYLNNYWQWSGGFTQYLSWIDGVPVKDPNVTGDYPTFMTQSAKFYVSEKANSEFRNTIQKIVTRVNTVTGKAYINDATIMSWQLANEPRPGDNSASDKDKEVFVQWINDAAKYIHGLDRNHLVSSGNEGLKGSAEDGPLFVKAHKSPYINYLTFHLWPRNWSWYNQKESEKTWPDALKRSLEYLNWHIDTAKQLNKPIVLEEFGLDRENGAYDINSTTHNRDRFYSEVLGLISKRATAGDAVAGFNFWAWNGSARTTNPDFWWRPGDAFMGDPPQEQQGMYGVFDSDISTIQIIKKFGDQLHALK
jgi:mannan endo-1,4-beta-mannosidase